MSGQPVVPPRRVIDVVTREGVEPPVSVVDLSRVLDRALDAAGAPPDATVGLVLSDDAELTDLNRQHMATDGPTDVLSFPLLPPEAFPDHPGRSAGPERPVGADFALPPGIPVHLGEIVVSVERARAQADDGRGGQTGDVRWTPADELRLLVTHGVLHLCGWDHADPIEGDAMRALERRLLDLP
jgi:probable rRNA maturation factor